MGSFAFARRYLSLIHIYGDLRALELIEESAPYAVADDSLGLVSELYNDIGGDLNTLLDDACTLYIMGEIDKDEYVSRMEAWKEQGGNDIADDFARLYEEKHL